LVDKISVPTPILFVIIVLTLSIKLFIINKTMNYLKHYNALIARAQLRIIDGYVEKHHRGGVLNRRALR
jgi:hypothetical protein